MKKVNYLLIIVAVLISFLVLFVSLQSANKAKMLGGKEKLMASKFYVAKEILPDHVLYPLLMVVDRLRMEMADTERKISLSASYSDRRLFYSKRLLEKGNFSLAFTTLSKALKYTNQGLSESTLLIEKYSLSKNPEYQRLAFFVLENYDRASDFVINNRDQFSNEENVVLEPLYSESNYLAEKLRGLMDQSIQN